MNRSDVIKIQVGGNAPEERNSQIDLEPILNGFMDDYMRSMNSCCVARVVNVQYAEQLRVDVQPLNNIRHKDNTVAEAPIIPNVPVFCYGTDESAFLVPIKQGQTIILLYSQRSMDDFKSGMIEPHSTMSNRKNDIVDAIALPSIFPFNRSPNNPNRHFTDHDINDVTVVGNLGTSRENKIVLKRDGSMVIKSPSLLVVDAPSSHFKGTSHFDGEVTTDVDFIIQGRSVKKFMDTHNHNYTDDGSPMVTEKPNGE